MSLTSLVREIGILGDEYSQHAICQTSADGEPYPFDPSKSLHISSWSLVDRCYERIAAPNGEISSFLQWVALFVVVLFLGPLDLIHALVRISIFPCIYGLWWLDRRLMALRSRAFFCPNCFNPMKEPLVYCAACRTPQPQLRPTFGNLLIRKCDNPDCPSPSRWFLLGQAFKTPGPIACRNTPSFKGCCLPHRCFELVDGCQSKHAIVIGPSIECKHAVMGHLLAYLHHVGARKAKFVPVGELDRLEYDLFVSHLSHAFRVNTVLAEKPGKKYELATSLLLRSTRRKQLLAFHNIPVGATASDAAMRRNVPGAELNPSVIFVLNEAWLVSSDGEDQSHVEVFSRFVRRVQRRFDMAPVKKLSTPLHLVLPVPLNSPLRQYAKASGIVPSETTQQLLRRNDSAFYSLVSACVKPNCVRFYGGLLPDEVKTDSCVWLQPLAIGLVGA